MKNALMFLSFALVIASGCALGPNSIATQQSDFNGSGFGISLGWQWKSASAAGTAVESEAAMGKWASQLKRGSAAQFGRIQAPLAAPTDWTGVTGGVGVITVARVAPIPADATQMLWRAIDNTTQLLQLPGNATLTGLVSGRQYKVQAAWYNGAVQVSDWSPILLVNAG